MHIHIFYILSYIIYILEYKYIYPRINCQHMYVKCRNQDNVLCMTENQPNGLVLLVKLKSSSVFHLAHYHRSGVSVIIQFCHTRLAWIVCIISSCGQCEAICCKITSLLPEGRSLTVCPDCLCSLIIHSWGHRTLKQHAGPSLCVSCLFTPPNFHFWWHRLGSFPHLVASKETASQLDLAHTM